MNMQTNKSTCKPQKHITNKFNPLTDKFFWKFELNAMRRICPISLKGLMRENTKCIAGRVRQGEGNGSDAPSNYIYTYNTGRT